jgi:hypothetical protein
MKHRFAAHAAAEYDQWPIAIRRSTAQTIFIADARAVPSEFVSQKGYLVVTPDHRDLSHQRSLSIDGHAPAGC